jgi:hypothetical protein
MCLPACQLGGNHNARELGGAQDAEREPSRLAPVARARGDRQRIQCSAAELAADPHTEHHPYWLISISAGEHTARAAIAWADESLAALSQLT